jgi:hypothetical protein
MAASTNQVICDELAAIPEIRKRGERLTLIALKSSQLEAPLPKPPHPGFISRTGSFRASFNI